MKVLNCINILEKKMKFLIFGLLSFLIIFTEARIEFTQTAKDCIAEIKTDEETIRSILEENPLFPEDNELVLKFVECKYRSHINDNNEIIADDSLKDYVTEILAKRLNGKTKLAALIANDCVEHCKDQKGDSKGKTGVKLVNCVKQRFWEYVK
ncbi:hypothetical protein ILUMI_17283 [Ignelater luminosus]|uniref:Uncharacterized protein n=1 Tax=Ignelater luminosus TaxID=2038154 RepID=A0A8K0CKE2_IGNLU|nr:hypothetical protein ILUMI_17283 [Ignelater luminosus]